MSSLRLLPRDFDVVVVGSTGASGRLFIAFTIVSNDDIRRCFHVGYTGKLVAEYLSKSYPTGLKWAIAGRSEAKLKTLHSDLKLNENVQILVADSEGATIAIVRHTR